MSADAARRIALRAWLGVLWKPPIWSVPFALLFGTLYARGADNVLERYLGAYLVALVFGYVIMACVTVNERVAIPMAFASTPRVGTRQFWIMMVMYAVSSILGSAIAALIIHHTLLPGFLGNSRQIAIMLTWAVLFTVLISGIMMAFVFYRGAIAHARSEQELNLARRIQNSFLISQFPARPRLEVHAVNVSSREVSGDFYDMVPAGDDAFFLAIADVAGKGVPAALMSSMLQASLRTQAMSGAPVSEVLRNINALVYRSTSVNQFATFFLAHVDERRMRLSYSNAGHNHPVVVSKGGGQTTLERGGTVVGILETVSFEEDAIALEPGDRVVMYTDGISEAANARGEMYGDARVAETLSAMPHDLSARELTERLLQSVRDFLGGLDAGDDMTLMVLRVLETPAEADAAAPAPAAAAASERATTIATGPAA